MTGHLNRSEQAGEEEKVPITKSTVGPSTTDNRSSCIGGKVTSATSS